MFPKEQLDVFFDNLISLYDQGEEEQSPLTLSYYCKLAHLECCGWIECSLDEILNNYCTVKLETEEHKKHAKNKIKEISGFLYEKHFKPLFCNILGVYNYERLEGFLAENNDLESLKTKLNTLWEIRRRAAHTSITIGVTPSFESPHLIKNHFETLYPIFVKIETFVTTRC